MSLSFLRKLKNRVAAQTARDRKKARMSELEQQVVDLEEEVKILKAKHFILRPLCSFPWWMVGCFISFRIQLDVLLKVKQV